MRRALLLLPVTGLIGLLGLAVGCDRGKQEPAQGSGLPAPQANLMKTVANGVFEHPRAGPASPAGAVAPPADADAAPPTEAVAATSGPTLSAKGGLSTLGKLYWDKQDEQETAKLIEKRIGIAGATVRFDVMDVPGDVEREEGYWSVKRGGKTDMIQVLRAYADPENAGPAAVIVWTADVPTADGIKVGDTFATLVAKHPDVKCAEGAIAETVYADIACTSPSEKGLVYFINPNKAKLKRGKAKPDTADIVGIAHEF